MLYDIPLRAGQTSLGNTSYWLDSTFEPEFPFGYGLTYTTFEYSAPEIEMTEYVENDTIRACVTIRNTGDKEATEVVQLYVRDLVGSVTRPVKELKRFHRVTLAPGQTMTVGFELPVQDLAFYGKDMVKKVEPGKFQLWIAGDSASGTPVEFEVK
jgi:beta-glucosidase